MKIRWAGVVFCLTMVFFVARGKAQVAGTGSIQGVVKDASGAVIPNASVTITNSATQVKQTTKTDTTGLYSFPNIPIGTYILEVKITGFRTYSRADVVVNVGSSVGVNPLMTVGSVTQTVSVRANALALQTQDSSFKQTINESTVNQLPLNGREITSLITLSGAAVPASVAHSDLASSKNFHSSVAISVAGGQGSQTAYRLDGADNTDYMTNVNLPFPFPDAVAEFSVETAAMGAQTGGNHPGGFVNVVTKSGTNQWHGDAFEYIRNNYIDATNFFSTKPDQLHQDQFGGTLGGPILKNKLFFFAGYQHTLIHAASASLKAYVPTAANLRGDFSVTDGPTCTPDGKFHQLLNPVTGAILPNNQIDPTYFNKSSLALMAYIPPAQNPCGQVTYARPEKSGEDYFITREDWTVNSKNSVFARYYTDWYTNPAYLNPTNALVTTVSGNYQQVQGLTVGWNDVLSASLVNTFNAATTIRNIDRGPVAPGIYPALLGINAYSSPTYKAGMEMGVSGKWAMYCNFCEAGSFNTNTFTFSDDLNWIHGKHQVALGGELVRSQFNVVNLFNANGNFSFTGQFSEKGPVGASPGGTGLDANLDFLTGSAYYFNQSNNQQSATRLWAPSLYIQDTYHASSALTVSVGVRWQPSYLPYDYFGRGVRFNLQNLLLNIHSTVYPNAPAGSLYYPEAGINKAFSKNYPLQFSPRIGITYMLPGHKTVLRAGWAIMYDTPGMFTSEHIVQNAPWSINLFTYASSRGPVIFSDPWSQGTVTTNPFPVTSSAPEFPPGAEYYTQVDNFRQPYTIQWTASVQRQFGLSWRISADYLGNETHFMPYSLAINPAVYIPGVWGANGTGCNGIVRTGPDAVTPGAAGTPCSTLGNTASRLLLNKVNPVQGPSYAGGSGSGIISSGANANYNGLVLSAQHRMSQIFTLLTNYTWSHCIDVADMRGDVAATSFQNNNNYQADRGNCGFDFPDVFNLSLVATSHFSRFTGWKGLLANNWQIAPLIHITSGSPFTVVTGIDNSLTDLGNDRPNLVSGVPVYTHKTIRAGGSSNAQYLNPAAFTPNPVGTFGNAGRNAFRGPKFVQVDAALTRSFSLHERYSVALRLAAFNVLNHPNFNPPGSAGSGTPGTANSVTALTDGTFGQITSMPSNYGARVFQGSIKFNF